IETNVLADRLVMVTSELVPALFLLRRRGLPQKSLALSTNAQKAYDYIEKHGTATAGAIRNLLNAAGMRRPDPADIALSELQQQLLVDRGPSDVPARGVPYLSKEGFPYRLLELTHKSLVEKSQHLALDATIDHVLLSYLRPAVICSKQKFSTMFRLCLSA